MKSTLVNLDKHPAIFIAGTDTEIGKTYCTSLLLRYLTENGIDVNPFKPVSAGVEAHLYDEDGNYLNEDAYRLWQATHKRFTLQQINPIVFSQPIAPHIAAEIEGRELNYEVLDGLLPKALSLANLTLVEGAGGWHLPLNQHQLLSTWVSQHKMPVILVVGIRLGCLNHTLLTAEAIVSSGCDLIGWIPNFIQGENDIHRKNVEYLRDKLKQQYNAECLFEVQKDQLRIS